MKNVFRTFVCLILGTLLVLSTAACNNTSGNNTLPDGYTRPSNVNIDQSFTSTSKTLVAYFSRTNTTKGVAETIQELTDADIFEIERKEPYPESYTPTTEVAKEEKDNNARPELAVYLSDDIMEQYDTIILGFPIWWYTAPMAVLSFLNYYNLRDKTIYTFATSGGSPISKSTADIRSNTQATVNEGRLLNGNNETTIRNWLDGLGLIASPEHPENPNIPVDPDDNEQKPDETETLTDPNILIVYFTAEYGNTERLADYIHGQIGGDIVKIEAAKPYTSQELNYGIHNNRPEVEKNMNARPEIATAIYDLIDMSKYDTVFIGYPIWWWTAPMIIGTFLEHYDLTGYDVYPFTQSASMNTTHFTTSMQFVRECAAKNGTPAVHDGLFSRANSTTAIDSYLRTNGFNI